MAHVAFLYQNTFSCTTLLCSLAQALLPKVPVTHASMLILSLYAQFPKRFFFSKWLKTANITFPYKELMRTYIVTRNTHSSGKAQEKSKRVGGEWQAEGIWESVQNPQEENRHSRILWCWRSKCTFPSPISLPEKSCGGPCPRKGTCPTKC